MSVDHPMNLPRGDRAVYDDSVRPEGHLRNRFRRVSYNDPPRSAQKWNGVARFESIISGQGNCSECLLLRYNPLFPSGNKRHDGVFTGPKRCPHSNPSTGKDGQSDCVSTRPLKSKFYSDFPPAIMPNPFVGYTAATGSLTTGAFTTGTRHIRKIARNSGVLKWQPGTAFEILLFLMYRSRYRECI